MPFPGRSKALPTSVVLLVYAFAVAAALLWIGAFVAPHATVFPAGPNYADITVYKGRFTLYHTARFFTSKAYSGFAYPAGAAVLYELFYKTGDATTTYLVLSAIGVLAGTGVALWLLAQAGALKLAAPLALATSFPLVFLIQRANIELLLWLLIAAGILMAWRGWSIPAAILFGIGFAIKLYPILLLGLFLRRRRDLPAFAIGVVSAILAMGFAIAHAGPTFSIAAQGFFTGIDRFQNHYVDTVSKVEIAFDHCLFSPFKYLAYLDHESPAPWRATYYLVAATLAILIFLRVRTLPFLNVLIFLTGAMVALPPVSFSYTLVHLELPLVLLLAALAGPRLRASFTAMLALALLLALMLPLPALHALGVVPTGPLASVLLAALLLATALQPWPSGTPADGA
ncbi:Protein of unknown function [Bryocella elongata]|uniref:DUF2029 domain-containing protein n=1 Tax=Bryocella elongata TaxID=863522 RepID=A0A1H5SXI8_9BACT|nr:glycosyltransferase 87 family protein [Bryocella elongata]SEF55322.1 Protein of unknown function [Bryocella elongata]